MNTEKTNIDNTNTRLARPNRKKLGAQSALNELLGGGYAKLPPQALELEEAVLGALMLERDPLNAVIDILSPTCFYKESHQKIYEAIIVLFQRSEPVDILTVAEELRKMATLEIVGGAFYLAQLTNKVASSANTEFHARIILQKHIQRELIRISSETIRDAYDETSDAFELLDSAEKNLFEIAESGIKRNFENMTKLVSDALKQIEEAGKIGEGVTGVPSGFTALDRVTGGWQKSDLIILAARPGMGKTAFVLSLARNAAIAHKRSVAVFSLEMSSVQLVNRLISSESEIDMQKLKRGELKNYEWQQLHARITKLTEASIFIDDTPALSVFELRAKCRRLKAQRNIEMIIIDYLQLMTTGGEGKGQGNREQEISTISRALKSIAKELNVPVIALSQLSRNVESRGGDKRPQLSDLRESGAIEQDADMVNFIYRPEYYNIDQDEAGSSTKGMAEIIIAKHRNGALENVRLRFISQFAKFVDYDDQSFTQGITTIPSSLNENDYANNIRPSKLNTEDLPPLPNNTSDDVPF